ncbi:MAG: helix-turn-helix transcriptional regulator [Clostridia bacterium]|nr:helix-turn-helix transcriptional regulator [Clostridia bacterium]
MYGEEIKTTRKMLNYTQNEVSKATGIPQNTLSWIELNKGIPNIQQCVLLADFYGITVDELIGRDTIPNKKSAVVYNNSTHNGNNNF